MDRKRRFTPTMRRRLAELDDKTGLGDDVIEAQADAAQRRMAVVDAQPKAWRRLLNQYPHQIVAVVAESAGTPAKARRVLKDRLGRPLD